MEETGSPSVSFRQEMDSQFCAGHVRLDLLRIVEQFSSGGHVIVGRAWIRASTPSCLM
jgi:hypothetical protein